MKDIYKVGMLIRLFTFFIFQPRIQLHETNAALILFVTFFSLKYELWIEFERKEATVHVKGQTLQFI